LKNEGYTPWIPDQIIINEYTPGQGIKPHLDHITSFAEIVISLTLLSSVTMDFTSIESKESKPIYLERRSLVILSGDARYKWTHGIEGRLYDTVKGKTKQRGRRISITFRKALLQE